MANLILKPSTGGVLKIQNDDGTVDALSVSTGGNLTAAGTLGVTGAVTASSTLGVTGNTTLSGSANNLGTVTAGSIAGGSITSATTFPSGHVITNKMIHYDKLVTSHNSTTSTSSTLIDTGIHGTYTPKKSSGAGGSWLLVNFYTSFSQCQGNTIFVRCAMTSANDTSYDQNDMLFTGTYTHIVSSNDAFTHWWMFNSASDGNQEANTPPNLTSYTGGTPYYFRLWWSVSGGTGYLGHSNGTNHLRIQEVMV